MVARFRSFRQPETISLALAEYWLTSTTSGRVTSSASFLARAPVGGVGVLRAGGGGGGWRGGGGGDDGAGADEAIAHVDRRRQQAAGIVTQVEDDAAGVALLQ